MIIYLESLPPSISQDDPFAEFNLGGENTLEPTPSLDDFFLDDESDIQQNTDNAVFEDDDDDLGDLSWLE